MLFIRKCAQPIENASHAQRHEYIMQFENMHNHVFTKHGWRTQETKKSKILSPSYVLDIMKWFKNRGVEYILELLGDAMSFELCEHWDQLLLRVKS